MESGKFSFKNKRVRRIAILLALVVVVIFGARLYYVRHQITDPDEDYKYEAIVQITASGFTPATINVKPDTKVFWENADSPAVHLIKPAPDDSEKDFGSTPVQANTSDYSHVFRHKGTFKYYDPQGQSSGVVVVE